MPVTLAAISLEEKNGWMALMRAADGGHAETVTALLAAPGLDVNAPELPRARNLAAAARRESNAQRSRSRARFFSKAAGCSLVLLLLALVILLIHNDLRAHGDSWNPDPCTVYCTDRWGSTGGY